MQVIPLAWRVMLHPRDGALDAHAVASAYVSLSSTERSTSLISILLLFNRVIPPRRRSASVTWQ